MAKSNLDSSDDSVVDKSPRRSDKRSTVGTLSKQERNDDKHNQQQSPNTVQTPSGFRDEASSPTDCSIFGSEQTTEPTDVVDVSKRVVKDGGGKLGMYTGACRMTTNTLTGATRIRSDWTRPDGLRQQLCLRRRVEGWVVARIRNIHPSIRRPDIHRRMDEGKARQTCLANRFYWKQVYRMVEG